VTRTPYLPPEPLPGEDWYADDPALARFLARRLSPEMWKATKPRLERLGTVAPREVDPLAKVADARPPRLVANEIVLDASYRKLQALAREHRVFTHAWHGGNRLTSFALGYLYAQAECGYFCPACMTDGAAYVLRRHAPQLNGDVARLVQDDDRGAYEGAMFLTEHAGGSDVGASGTLATPGADGSWRLTGDKWFCSNANAEIVLTLAHMPDAPPGTRGLGLFLVRGEAEGLRRVTLKEKLGVRSMATAECELRDCAAELIAGEGEGFRAMAEMVNLSRLYNAVASVAIARRALREGQKNGAWRSAFGKSLKEHALYAQAVAALAVDVRGALLFVLDTADAFDRAAAGADAALLRGLTPLAKAETARLAVRAASAACELLGGNGYTQPWVTERLLRDAQVLPIWEGTTNVQALDFLRTCAKDGSAGAIASDSLARLPLDSPLVPRWRAWADEMQGVGEAGALRMLTRGYHLRCATLLATEEEAPFAEAYRVKNVEMDERAFEALAREQGNALCGWPTL